MADIAILVAEEYERRVKNSRKLSKASDSEMEVVNWVSFLAQNVKDKVRVRVSEENIEIPKWILEPKSQVGVAASNGFFSA